MRRRNRKSRKRGRRRPPVRGPLRILAIDPGTRYMGVAFLVGKDLVRADVENVPDPWLRPAAVKAKTEVILGRWIRRYGPDVIAVEKAFFAQSKRSRRVHRIVQAITAVARREGVRLKFYLPTTARRAVCRQGRATRLAVARILATEHYPWLYPYYEKETRRSWWRQRYWATMFDAIAVGLTCAEDVSPKATSRKAA